MLTRKEEERRGGEEGRLLGGFIFVTVAGLLEELKDLQMSFGSGVGGGLRG